MIKLNTTANLKDLEGKDLADFNVGKTLSNIIASEEKAADPMKNFVLAQRLYTQGEVELGADDVIFLKEAVKRTSRFTALVTGQLLIILEELKEVKSEKGKKD